MKEGRKIYSLLLKAESGDYYRVKIKDDYYNPLAIIDAFTIEYENKKMLCEGYSTRLNTKIEEAKIVYQKDGKTKAIEPLFEDMKEFGELAVAFGKNSGVDSENHIIKARIRIFAHKLLEEYYQDITIKRAFDSYGDYIVDEALKNNDLEALINRLCEYRKLRKSALLQNKAKLGEKIDGYPIIWDLTGAKIIKTDERFLELIDNKIKKLQTSKSENSLVQEAMALLVEGLYKEREELILNLGVKEDKNQVPGQTKMMF